MKILTKLMLASAVMVTSGFAGTTTTIDEDTLMQNGWDITGNNTATIAAEKTVTMQGDGGAASDLNVKDTASLTINGTLEMHDASAVTVGSSATCTNNGMLDVQAVTDFSGYSGTVSSSNGSVVYVPYPNADLDGIADGFTVSVNQTSGSVVKVRYNTDAAELKTDETKVYIEVAGGRGTYENVAAVTGKTGIAFEDAANNAVLDPVGKPSFTLGYEGEQELAGEIKAGAINIPAGSKVILKNKLTTGWSALKEIDLSKSTDIRDYAVACIPHGRVEGGSSYIYYRNKGAESSGKMFYRDLSSVNSDKLKETIDLSAFYKEALDHRVNEFVGDMVRLPVVNLYGTIKDNWDLPDGNYQWSELYLGTNRKRLNVERFALGGTQCAPGIGQTYDAFEENMLSEMGPVVNAYDAELRYMTMGWGNEVYLDFNDIGAGWRYTTEKLRAELSEYEFMEIVASDL